MKKKITLRNFIVKGSESLLLLIVARRSPEVYVHTMITVNNFYRDIIVPEYSRAFRAAGTTAVTISGESPRRRSKMRNQPLSRKKKCALNRASNYARD